MKTDKYQVELVFQEEMLGTVPKDKEIYSTYIESKKPVEIEAEETDTIEMEEKGWTGFHSENDKPFIYDYMLKGFFKDACGMLRRQPKSESSKLKAYKKIIDGLIFVNPRKIFITLKGGKLGVNERPIRIQGPQGERVALARSDTAPAGSSIEFEITILGGVSKKLLKEWMDYGILRGLGQWRNAGFGKFSYKFVR